MGGEEKQLLLRLSPRITALRALPGEPRLALTPRKLYRSYHGGRKLSRRYILLAPSLLPPLEHYRHLTKDLLLD